MNELSEVIAQLLEELNIEVPTHDTDLFATGLLDSLTFVELLTRLEEQLAISVSFDQLEPENFRSIANMASFVLRQRTQALSA